MNRSRCASFNILLKMLFILRRHLCHKKGCSKVLVGRVASKKRISWNLYQATPALNTEHQNLAVERLIPFLFYFFIRMVALFSQIVQLFVCLGFFVPLEKFSLMETSPLPVTKHDNTYLVMQNSAKKYFVINTVTYGGIFLPSLVR